MQLQAMQMVNPLINAQFGFQAGMMNSQFQQQFQHNTLQNIQGISVQQHIVNPLLQSNISQNNFLKYPEKSQQNKSILNESDLNDS